MARAPDGGSGGIGGSGSVGSNGGDGEGGDGVMAGASKVTSASLSGSGEISRPRPPIAKRVVGSGATAAAPL